MGLGWGLGLGPRFYDAVVPLRLRDGILHV